MLTHRCSVSDVDGMLTMTNCPLSPPFVLLRCVVFWFVHYDVIEPWESAKLSARYAQVSLTHNKLKCKPLNTPLTLLFASLLDLFVSVRLSSWCPVLFRRIDPFTTNTHDPARNFNTFRPHIPDSCGHVFNNLNLCYSYFLVFMPYSLNLEIVGYTADPMLSAADSEKPNLHRCLGRCRCAACSGTVFTN